MNTLFDLEPVFPEGFTYEEDFISTDEETRLLENIRQYDLQNMKFHAYVAKRKISSFGLGWSFTEQTLKPGDPIPMGFYFLIERIAQKLSMPTDSIAQFLITEYPVGSLINWHRDAPPFDIVAGVSLATDCIFKLRPLAKEKQTKSATISLPVKPRSLYTMQGPAKTEWQHSTAPAKQVRYSLTFRTLRPN